MYIISGANVQELSKDLTDRPNLYLQAVENYTARIDHTQFVHLVNNLSTVDAKTYLPDANFGYNYTQKELVVSNPNYDYSYVYSFKSGTWHKISETFKTIIRSYPKLLVINENASNSGVFDLTLEQDSTHIDVLLTTKPCKVEEGGSILFTLIHRAILRCELNTGASTFAGFYVFGSNDLKTWQLFQGSDNRIGEITDLFCLRSHLKVKYFVFVFAANLKEGEILA